MTLTEYYRQVCAAPTPRQALMARLQEATGASMQTVRTWCEGRKVPRRETRTRIAELLHCDAAVLFPSISKEKK